MQLPKELQLAGLVWIVGDRVSLNEVQLPKELQPVGPFGVGFAESCLNEVQLPQELQPCKTSLCSRFVCLNEVQLPKELQLAQPRPALGVSGASMKCSSRRNCNGPLSIACHQAHLRPLRERSVRGLGLSRICLQLSPPNPCRSNVLSLRALPEVLRAPERSRQAMSGPSDVMVLVRPT